MRWIREHRFASSTGYRHLINALTYDGARLSQSGAICVATDFDQQLYRVLLSAESEKVKTKKTKRFRCWQVKMQTFIFKASQPIVVINTFYLLSWFTCTDFVSFLMQFCLFCFIQQLASLSLRSVWQHGGFFFYFQTWRKKQEKPINKYEKFHVVCDGVCFWLVSMMKTFCVERLAGKNFSHRHLS